MKIVDRLSRSPFIAGSLVCALVFFIILGLRTLGSLEPAELAAYDWIIRLQPRIAKPDPRIVLVEVTESDIQHLGQWPLPDAILAEVLMKLIQHQPRAIGFDIYRDIPVPPGHEKLNETLTRNRNIIAVTKFGNKGADSVSPPSVLKNTDQVGFSDMVIDSGGVVRRAALFMDDGKTVFYSFAFRLAMLYLQAEDILPQPDPSNPLYLRLGQNSIRPIESNAGGYVGADARGYQFLLNLKQSKKGFLSYSLTTLRSGKIDPKTIKDKIVIIGVNAESVKDAFYASSSGGGRTNRIISGVGLHAHVVSQLLRFGIEGEQPISTTNRWFDVIWILIWSFMGGMTSLRIRSTWRFSLLAASGLLILTLAVYFSYMTGWWIPFVPPAMAWLASAAIVTAYMVHQEKKHRGLLMQLFSRHVSQEIADAVWQDRDQFLMGGRPRPQKLIATVLFSDMIGFTSVSEKLNPRALMDWLNEYMEDMAQQVAENGGVINKYIGDAILAVFGVPLPRNDESEISRDAVNAVNCALAMEKELIQLNRAWNDQNLPSIGMRIGIFTGPLVAGSLGSAQRLEYTVIGDTVNIASRLESFDKDSFNPDFAHNPCRILIGEETLRYLGNHFQTQRVGEVSLKGKDQPVIVYRIVKS